MLEIIFKFQLNLLHGILHELWIAERLRKRPSKMRIRCFGKVICPYLSLEHHLSAVVARAFKKCTSRYFTVLKAKRWSVFSVPGFFLYSPSIFRTTLSRMSCQKASRISNCSMSLSIVIPVLITRPHGTHCALESGKTSSIRISPNWDEKWRGTEERS